MGLAKDFDTLGFLPKNRDLEIIGAALQQSMDQGPPGCTGTPLLPPLLRGRVQQRGCSQGWTSRYCCVCHSVSLCHYCKLTERKCPPPSGVSQEFPSPSR